MEVVATSVIAVFGALLGSALTYVFQRRTADRAQHGALANGPPRWRRCSGRSC